MKWMEIAWSQVGVAEVPGRGARPEIVSYFAEVGREDITSDETAWCAAFVGACLTRGGVDTGLDPDETLLARSFLRVGQKIDKPRTGAVAIFQRGNSWQGHVGFIVGETDTTIALLGGNQANQVSVVHYSKTRLLACVWPEVPKSETELAAAGSRTVKTARQAKKDAGKSAVSGTASQSVEAEPWSFGLDGLTAWSKKLSELQGALGSLADFTNFALAKAPIVLGVLAVYWALKVVWAQGWIAWFRTEDHNTGTNQGRRD